MMVKEEEDKRQNAKETKAHLEATVLRTKQGANKWLHLTTRVAALGMDTFEWSTDDCENLRLPRKKIKYGGKQRRENNRMRRKDEPDDTGDILDSEGFERTKSMLEGW